MRARIDAESQRNFLLHPTARMSYSNTAEPLLMKINISLFQYKWSIHVRLV
jgi:hypothetical protein